MIKRETTIELVFSRLSHSNLNNNHTRLVALAHTHRDDKEKVNSAENEMKRRTKGRTVSFLSRSLSLFDGLFKLLLLRKKEGKE